MNFYTVWHDAMILGINDNSIIYDFLNKTEISKSTLEIGEVQDQTNVYATLGMVPLEHLFEIVATIDSDMAFTPADIPCFSTFENGANRMTELLEFAPDGLSFSEIGYQLIKASHIGAQTKYGENHAKLAQMMSLVSITNTRPAIVNSTPWGRFLLKYTLEDKCDVLKKLLLRNAFIQKLIAEAFNGFVSYRNISQCLSDSTSYRRRTSVKILVEYILKDTNKELCLNNIEW
jgi:hypothetical protein